MKRFLTYMVLGLFAVMSFSLSTKQIEANTNQFEFSFRFAGTEVSSIEPSELSNYVDEYGDVMIDVFVKSIGQERTLDAMQATWQITNENVKFNDYVINIPEITTGRDKETIFTSITSTVNFGFGWNAKKVFNWTLPADTDMRVATLAFTPGAYDFLSPFSIGVDFLGYGAALADTSLNIHYDRTKVKVNPIVVSSAGEDASLASLTVGGQPISVGSDGSNYNTSITYGDSLLSLETLIKALPTKASAVVTLEKSTTGNVKVNDVVTITVTDGSVSQTHTVTFIDVGSPILELSQLNFLANGYGISPVFNSATTNYQIEIPGAQQATGFSINPVALESYAITEVYLNNVLQSDINGKYQFSNLTGGDHTVLVIVKAGGESKNYTLNVNQKVLDSTATIQDFGVVVSKYPTASGTESIDAFGTSTLLENQDKFSFKVNFIESTIKKVDFLVKVDGTQTLAGTLTKNTTIAGQWSYVTGISVPKGKTAEVILNATAENGDIVSNTFFVQRAQSSYAELGQSDILLSENGVDYTAVRSNNIYTYNVREDQTTSLLFKVLSTSNALKENASITLRDADTNALIPGGNISVSAQEGSKSYKIVVVSEDGLVTNEYILNVVRLSNDLSFSIKVTKTGSLDELLNTASFTLSGSKWIAQTKLVYDVNGVDVFLEANHPNATISIKNNGGGTFATTNQNSLSGSLGYNLVAEQTRTFTVTITAENKVTIDYEISITREKANTINTLESFMIGGNQPGDFIADQVPPTTYQKLVLDPDLTAPTLYVNAEVTGGNTLGYTTVKYEYKRSSDTTYTTGQSITYVRGVIYDVKVTVTSQAGISNTYLVQMVVADTNNQINDVLIEDASNNGIPFSFDKSKMTYTIEVNAPVASLKFNVTKDSDSASLTSGADANGFVTLLQAGQTTVVKLYLTSESGDKGTEYTFNIVRKAYRSNTDINSIEVIVSNEDGTISFTPTYDSTRSAYYLRIDSTYYANVVVKATLPTISTGSYFNGNKQVFSETKTIAAGSEATYQIRVVAEDGQTYQDYPVIVKRANQTTTFDHVVLNGQTYTFSQFVAGTLDLRSMEIPFSLSKMDLTIEESDTSRATVELTNPALIDGQWVFNSTGVVEFRFTMLAEDQTTKTTYKIQLTRLQASTDASLKEFQFNSSIGNLLEGVVPLESGNNVTYTIRVDRGVTIDSIVATPNHPNATKNILYTSLDLVAGGEKQFSITVEAEDKTIKRNYHVVIIQKNDNHVVNDISFAGIDYDFTTHVNSVNLGSFLFSHKTFLVTVNREDTYAKVLVDGVLVSLDTNNQFVYNLKQGSQSLTIQTESEFGTKGAIYRYTYTQEVASSEAVLKSLSAKVDGVDLLSGMTLNNLIELSLDRSYNGKTITLLGVADKNGTITSGNTSKALSVGLNTFEIIVRSEDGTTSSTYTIKIYVYSSVSTLNTLSISELSSFTYDNLVFSYDLGVFNYSAHQGKLTLNLTYGDTYAKLYIDGVLTTQTSVSYNLKEGSHVITVRVVAEDTQTEVNYTLSYERLSAKTDNDLEGLEVMVGGVNQLDNFDPLTLSYELRVDRSITSLEIIASVNPSALSKVSGAGTKVVNVGVDNTYLVVVTAEDGQTRTYQIKVVSKNDVSEINDIVISGITYDFSSHVNTKDLGSFPYSQKSFTIRVEKADPWMTILVDGVLVTLNQNKEFTYTLKQGTNTFKIEGVSEYGTKGESYLYQYTQEVASSEAVLKSLSAKVDGVDLLSGMTLSKLTELEIPRSYVGKTISILGVADHNGTVTGGNGSKALTTGLNTFEVIVKSEDGLFVATYVIKIYVVSDVASITNLSINELSNVVFDKQIHQYDLGIFNYSDYQTFRFNLTYLDQYAKLYVDGSLQTLSAFDYSLKTGTHVIVIKVIAEDLKTEVIYEFYYERLSAKTDNNLEGLEVMVGGVNQLDNFDPSTLSYELRVDRSITSLEIIASVNPSALSKVSGAGTKVVNVGVDNTYLVVVTAEDGQTRTYQIKVVSKNDVSEINDIVISGITYDFSSHVNTKDLGSFPYSQKSFTIRVEKADPWMTILVDGVLVTLNQNKEFTYTLKQGTNTFKIEGVSEYGTRGEAYLYQYIQEVASSEAVLKSLSAKVDGVDLLSGMTLNHLMEVRIDRINQNKTITLFGVADHNGSVIEGNGVKVVVGGLNTFKFVVRSEDGSVLSEYTLLVYVLNDDNEVSDLVLDGNSLDSFDQNTRNYVITTPYTYDILSVDVLVVMTNTNSRAIITNQGQITLKDGKNVILITVRSEYMNYKNDASKDLVFEIEITREKAFVDTDLSNLVVTDELGNVLNFDTVVSYKSGIYNYNITLDKTYKLSGITIEATLKNALKQQLTGDTGYFTIIKQADQTIKQTFNFVVSAENNQSKTYSITILQGTTLSSDTTIKSAALRDFFGVEYLSQENAFDKETLTYQINVPYLVTNLNLMVLTNDQKAVVSGSGQYAIMGDYLQISFVVTAEDKSVGETYTIEVHRQQASTNANLNLLEVKDEQGNLLVGLLDDHPTKLVFEQSKLAYRFKLDRSHELVDIFAVSEDSNARVTGDLATQFVLGGVINTLKVLVVAEDGKTQKTYFIYIEVKNSEASLLDLSVDGFSINYQPTIDTYDLGQVSKEIQQINIQGVLGDDYMSVTGLGRQVLTDGLNRFLVVVTSDDLTTKKTYEILVTKEKSNDGSISEDNVLYDLLVEGTKYSYDLEFDELTYVYDLSLAYEDDKFFLNGIKNPRASLTGGGLYALNPGDTKTIVVYVTAEDGTKGQNYLVNVTREEPSDLNQLLEFYVIENGVRYDLDETKTYQEITVNEHTSEITFGGVWPSNSKVTGLGVVSVIGSEKLYTIIVTSQSGNSKAYNVQVLKTSTDNLLSDLVVKDTKTGDILDYDPVFNPTTLNYMIDLTLRSDVIEVEIIATKNHAGAMVKGDGIHSLRSGVGMTTDRFNVTVTAQDGLSERTYVITISRNIDPSDDITIDELSLYGNTTLFLGNHVYPMALTQFTTSQLEYEITVPYQTSRMLLQVTNQNGATVYGAGEQIINENEVLIAFFLVSKSGKITSDNYVIRVIKEEPNSDNTLKSLQINGVLIDGFNPNLTNYELTVDSDKVSQLHVQATKNHRLSTLSGDLGNMPITRGKNTINITVVSESNESKVYQIVINAYSFDNTLLALGVENYDLDPVFDVNTLTYSVEVPYDVNMVNITGKAKNTSIITGLGVKSLAVGSNVFSIYVTSESGLEGKRYQIEVYRTEASDDTTLENLVVKDKNGNILSFTSPFNKDIKDYVINLDASTNLNSVIVEGIASNENASVYGVGNVLLGGFVDGLYHTIIKVSVMAESGLVEEYTISFYRGIVLDDQAEIEMLDLFGSNSLNYLGTQSNAQSIFDVMIKTYTIYVPHDVKNMNLMVTATGIVYGAGIKVFGQTNELTYTLRVTSKSGTTSSETYTINVIKQEAQTDNLLDSILIDGLALKDFDPNKTNYLIQIPMNPNKTSIYLDVQGKENQQIQGVGNKQLNPGENVFNLLVTAQNGEIKTYTVVVNYVDSNALLDSLYVKGSSEQTYKEETSITYFDQNSFDKLTFSYVVKVDVSTRYVRLTGTTEDQQSGARVQGFRTYEFKTSEPTKTIEIEVVSADGLQSQIYTILLTRDGVSDTDARLTSLVVEGKKLAFNPSMYHYQVSVGAKQETLKLSAQSFSPNAKVSVLGYEYLGESNELSIELDRLDVGKNEVLIKVEAQDGSIMYYRLSITKDSQPDYLLSVLLIITFLLWVITVAFFLVKLSRNKKQTTRRGLII